MSRRASAILAAIIVLAIVAGGIYKVTESQGPSPRPDSDGDGFADAVDKCRNQQGETQGCRDPDHDRVVGLDERCPRVTGTPPDGCERSKDAAAANTGERRRKPANRPPPPEPRAADTIGTIRKRDGVTDLGTFGGDILAGTIGGSPYDEVLFLYVYPNGSQPRIVGIKTEGAYQSMRGVAGIYGSADCVQNDARVSIEDDKGSVLWGPYTVSSRSERSINVAIRDAVEVRLVHRALPPGGDCEAANPAWGDLKFLKK